MAKQQSRRAVPSVENLEDRCLAAVDAFVYVQIQVETEAATQVFEIKDFSFDVENPPPVASATGGAGADKIKFAI